MVDSEQSNPDKSGKVMKNTIKNTYVVKMKNEYLDNAAEKALTRNRSKHARSASLGGARKWFNTESRVIPMVVHTARLQDVVANENLCTYIARRSAQR